MWRPAEVREAKLRRTEAGATPESEGWFVLNLADAIWARYERSGQWTELDSEDVPFTHYGIGVHVLHPGQPNGLYHAESVPEDFLVLSGECLLIVEEQERRLRAWDFVHCAPGTHHIFVGAGDGPCAILMVGARGAGKQLHYPVSDVAARHGASAPEETDAPRVAYRDWTGDTEPVRATWPP